MAEQKATRSSEFRKNAVGARFGRLTVTYIEAGKRAICICKCDCGATTHARWYDLSRRNVVSCSCHREEKKRRHGLYKTREYRAWASMIARCTTPSCGNFRIYGGRGIQVCAEWRHDFLQFLADMGASPSPSHSVDRIDVNGHYTPGNCRWATDEVQDNNKRTCKYMTYDGITLTITQWAKKLGVNRHALYQRKAKGWSDDRTINEPIHVEFRS